MIYKTIETIAQETAEKWKQLDPGRLASAVLIANKPHQIYNQKCPPGSYDVRGSAGGWYRVDTIAKTCTCVDHQQGNVCQHRLAVYLINEHYRLLETSAPKPEYTPHPALGY